MAGFDRADAPGRDPDAPMFDPEAHLGSLLVVQVSGIQEGVETEYGLRDVIVADVFVIGPPGVITEAFPDAWLFGTVLFTQLKKKKGRTVLGVLELGEKKQGRKAPYRLADPTDAQEQAAIRAMASRPDPAQQAPAADPWGQQAQQGGWQQPAPAQQPAGPPPGWGQQPQQPAQQPAQQPWSQPQPQQGPPPGWGQQPAAQQQLPEPAQPATAPGPWEQPASAGQRAPWE
jgi:hypothetical protein